MNKILKIFIFILLGVLQLTLMPIFSVEGTIPNLILIGAIILLLTDFEEDAFYLAACGGLILDLAGPFFFGFYTIFFLAFIFLIRFLLQKIVTELNLILTIVTVFIFAIILSLLENIFLGRWPKTDVLINGLYSVALGMGIFILLHRWRKKAQVIV